MYETEHVVWAIKRANRLKIATCRRDEETEKRENKSHKCDISPLCGGAPCEPISTKFGVFVGLINVITCAKNSFKTYISFSSPTGGKSMFPYRKPNGLYNIAMRYRAGLWSYNLAQRQRAGVEAQSDGTKKRLIQISP